MTVAAYQSETLSGIELEADIFKQDLPAKTFC
jgi:hypothetical protein